MTNQDNITLDPRFISAVQRQSDGKFEKAAQLYSELLVEFPDNIELLHRFSQTLLQIGKFREAIKHLDYSIVLEPDNFMSYFNLGIVYYKAGDIDEAIARFWTALKYNPNFTPAHQALSQIILPGEHYYQTLKRFHKWLKPANYVEIGVETGKSMSYAEPPTMCVGIDPAPQINVEFSADTKIFSETSDNFFEKYDLRSEVGDRPVELAFIDGLHNFEAVLRDFINIECYSSPDAVVLLHDCIPLDDATSLRERKTTFWSGDTWKIIPCLKHYRPDLNVVTIASPPTGLAAITHLDPESTTLSDNLDSAIAKFISLDYAYLGDNKYDILNVTFDDWSTVQEMLRL